MIVSVFSCLGVEELREFVGWADEERRFDASTEFGSFDFGRRGSWSLSDDGGVRGRWDIGSGRRKRRVVVWSFVCRFFRWTR